MSADADDRRNPYAEGVRHYLAAGWEGVLPIGLVRGVPEAGRKAAPPEGTTGDDGGWPTRDQISQWETRWGYLNLGLRLPSVVVGLDVDHYVSAKTGEIKRGAEVIERLEADWGALPATWRSSSRGDDNPSGVYLFRVPPGTRLQTAIVGGVEVIQRHHRYLVCWPSVHPEGRTYVWYDPAGVQADGPPAFDDDAIPELPLRWLEGLRAPDEPDRADYPLAAPQRAARADWAPVVVRAWAEAVDRMAAAQTGGRHDTACAIACGFARQEQLGLAGATSALETFGNHFVAAVAADRSDRGRDNGTIIAGREYQAIVASGRRTVAGTRSTVQDDRDDMDEFMSRYARRNAGTSGQDPGAAPSDGDDEAEPPEGATWAEADLRPAIEGGVEMTQPTVLRRSDGRGVFYPGQVNYVHGADGIGKSFLALCAAIERLALGEHVLWIDFEDPTPTTIVSRLLDFGVDPDMVLGQFHYINPDEPATAEVLASVREIIVAHGVTVVVIDSVGEAFGVDGIDENHDNEVTPWFRRVAKRFALLGPAVIPVDHGTKAGEAPYYPSGSKRKRAMVSGAGVLVEPVRPFKRGEGGIIRLVCAKDRHGAYRRQEVIGDLTLYIRPDGHLGWRLEPPPEEASDPGIDALNLAVAVAVRTVRRLIETGSESPPSMTTIELAMDIRARSALKRKAIEMAVERGLLREISGPRSARLFVLVSEVDDEKNT